MNGAAWWLPPSRSWRAGVSLRLLALPYAGGGATAFRPWFQALPAQVQVAAVQLPGRGARFVEAPLVTWPSLLEALVGAVLGLPDDGVPCMLFGHSAGALVAFELAKRLLDRGRAPAGLLVSGCRAPHLPPRAPPLSKASDAELARALERLGGTPAEALRQPELLALLLPVLRADCTLFDTHAPAAPVPLDLPITVFRGLRDPLVDDNEARAWAAHTRSGCRVHTVDAGHFYLDDAAFLRLLTASLVPPRVTAVAT